MLQGNLFTTELNRKLFGPEWEIEFLHGVGLDRCQPSLWSLLAFLLHFSSEHSVLTVVSIQGRCVPFAWDRAFQTYLAIRTTATLLVIFWISIFKCSKYSRLDKRSATTTTHSVNNILHPKFQKDCHENHKYHQFHESKHTCRQ